MSDSENPTLCGHKVGLTEEPLVIAEMSANHNGDIETAFQIVRLAASAGAKVVKFQHYTPDTLTIRSPLPEFRVRGGTLWDGTDLYDLYAEAMMPWEWTRDLVDLCKELGIGWFSSPFDHTAVDFLEEFDVPAYKVASFEVVDLPLIQYMAETGKPMVISTGMATLEEIDRAVDAAARGGCNKPMLLRCNSAYPSEPSEMDLAAIPFLRSRYGCEVGLSDHSIGALAAVTAVGLGATIFEKHVTNVRTSVGADAAFSADADEFHQYVADLTTAWKTVGSPRFGPSPREVASLAFRRSLRTTRRIAAGETITAADVRSMRPSGGLPPEEHSSIVGRRAAVDLEVGEALAWESLSELDEDLPGYDAGQHG
jgi:pseudaminic acid synthase